MIKVEYYLQVFAFTNYYFSIFMKSFFAQMFHSCNSHIFLFDSLNHLIFPSSKYFDINENPHDYFYVDEIERTEIF
jgi:hypothetical protein